MDELLSEFLQGARDAREYKRALAVQMAQQSYPYTTISQLLQVSEPFVSKWKRVYAEHGVAGLRLGYQGSEGFLTATERAEVLAWIGDQEGCDLAHLQAHLADTYAVSYQSNQSYYDLLHAAGLSWKKVQASNPKKKDDVVAAKHAEVSEYVETHREELEQRQRVMLFVDECFLHWGDVCGYGWGKRNERLTLDVVNTQARQPFYGGLDALTGEMHVMPYPVAQTDNTTDFLVELLYRYPKTKLTICWDNASWHKGEEMERFLARVNAGLAPEDWRITVINFAPHDPTQNPIEEVWRQGKAAIQKLRLVATKFHEVVEAFERTVERQFFDFPNRQRYGSLQMI